MQTTTKFSNYSCDVTFCQKLGQVLQDTKVSDLPGIESQNLVTFDSKEYLGDCFHKLIDHNIHSAPVFDADKNSFIGLLDWKDFCAYAIALLKLSEKDDDTKAKLLQKQNAGSLSDFSTHNHFFPIFKDSSLLTVLSGFSRYGVHRRPVFNTDSVVTTVVAMVSQSTIVQWLAQRRKDLKALDERRILQVLEDEEQNVNIKKLDFVYTVTHHAKMLDVLTLMVENNLTGVAVVHPTGTLIGNISVSDLKYLAESLLDNMILTVSEFLNKMPRKALVTVPSTASLGDVIGKLAQEGTYRCYVVDDDMHPVAVMTLTDVISAVLTMASEGGKDIS
jgi:CBS domain-containing protein